jgi:hypothetical protein
VTTPLLQNPPDGARQSYTLTLTPGEVNLLLNMASELPYKQVSAMLTKCQLQISAQNRPTAAPLPLDP